MDAPLPDLAALDPALRAGLIAVVVGALLPAAALARAVGSLSPDSGPQRWTRRVFVGVATTWLWLWLSSALAGVYVSVVIGGPIPAPWPPPDPSLAARALGFAEGGWAGIGAWLIAAAALTAPRRGPDRQPVLTA